MPEKRGQNKGGITRPQRPLLALGKRDCAHGHTGARPCGGAKGAEAPARRLRASLPESHTQAMMRNDEE